MDLGPRLPFYKALPGQVQAPRLHGIQEKALQGLQRSRLYKYMASQALHLHNRTVRRKAMCKKLANCNHERLMQSATIATEARSACWR